MPTISLQRYLLPVSLCLWLGIIFFLFFNVGHGSIRFWDEGLSALRALNMYEKGFSFTVQTHTTPDFNKPPLYYWLAAAFYHLLGPGLLAVRLPSVLFALGSFIMVWVLAKKITGSYWAAVFACFSLLLNSHWMNFARVGMLESSVAFFLLAAIALGGYSRYRHSMAGALGTGILLAATAWFKHPFFGAFLVLFYVHWRFVEKTPNAGKRLLVATLAFILLGFLWHVVQTITWGTAFTDYFFGHNVVTRLTTQIPGHKTSPLIFATPILRSALFTFICYVACGYHVVRSWKQKPSQAMLPFAITTVFFIIILVIKSKSKHHLDAWFPLLSLCAALGAHWFYHNTLPKIFAALSPARQAQVTRLVTSRNGLLLVLAFLVLWNIQFLQGYLFTPEYSKNITLAGRRLLAENKVQLPLVTYSREGDVLLFELKDYRNNIFFDIPEEEVLRMMETSAVRLIIENGSQNGSTGQQIVHTILQKHPDAIVTDDFTQNNMHVFSVALPK